MLCCDCVGLVFMSSYYSAGLNKENMGQTYWENIARYTTERFSDNGYHQ